MDMHASVFSDGAPEMTLIAGAMAQMAHPPAPLALEVIQELDCMQANWK